MSPFDFQAELPEGWFVSWNEHEIRVITAPGIGHITLNYAFRTYALGFRTRTSYRTRDADMGKGQRRKLEERAIAVLAAQPRIEK